MIRLALIFLLCVPAQAQYLLRIVEAGLRADITAELAQHQSDLENEGWTVETVDGPLRNSGFLQVEPLATNTIWPAIAAHTNAHIFLIGKLPYPRTGLSDNPDGHSDTTGAYASTAYYAMPGTTWTDDGDNSAQAQTAAHLNEPGDGKWDQSVASSPALASIGFLDLTTGFSKNTWGMGAMSNSDFDLMLFKQYFTNLHNFRTGAWTNKNFIWHGKWTGAADPGFVGQFPGIAVPFAHSVESNSFYPNSLVSLLPVSIIYDFKVTPDQAAPWWTNQFMQNGGGVFNISFESYQIDFGVIHLQYPLVTGWITSGCYTFGAWDLSGWETKTVGELWRQSVSSGNYLYRVLYGDPTVKIANNGPPGPVATRNITAETLTITGTITVP